MDLTANSLWTMLGIFALAAALVWVAGTRVAEYADELAHRFDLSRAFLGLFMLATISSLPEIATGLTAAARGNADLAVNNLLGSVVLQVTLLAIADLVIGKKALTTVVPDPLVMLQGNLSIVMLALLVVAITVGDIPVFGAGAWSWGLIGFAALSAAKLVRAGRQPQAWIVNPDVPVSEAQGGGQGAMPRKNRGTSLRMLYVRLGLAALAILLAGAVLSHTGEAIGEQSGIGQSFAGMALLSVATSLPEISIVFACVRAGLYTMAISDIFGTSFVNVALIGGVDLLDQSDAILNEVGAFSALAATLGIVVIGLFMAGLAEREDRTILRMGTDSIMVLFVYAGGMFLLFHLRDGGA